ncbi:MAG: hypothetical protein QXY35_07390 [Thermofilaceae archaeon]
MRSELAVKLVELSALLMIAGGALIIALGATTPPPASFMLVLVGAVAVIMGIVFYSRISKAKRRILRGRGAEVRRLASAVVLVAFLSWLTSGVAYAMSPEVYMCFVAYQRVVFVQYSALILLLAAAFLAFIPMVLGRTAIGAVLGELQPIAGTMLLVLIFLLLFIFPLDVMFVMDNYQSPTTCSISLDRLRSQGPPLLRIILHLLIPPHPAY